MPGMFQVVLVYGVIDDSLHITFVIAYCHETFKNWRAGHDTFHLCGYWPSPVSKVCYDGGLIQKKAWHRTVNNTSDGRPATSSQSAWSHYWRRGHLHSCPGAFQGNYEDSIREFWHSTFKELGEHSRVLDIGTGNGAIARLALDFAASRSFSWQIEGIDAADIQSADTPINSGQCKLTLRGNQSSEHLDHADDSVNLVTSQYAIEYTRVDLSLAQVARVLVPGGIAAFIVHHTDANIVTVSRNELAFFDYFYQQLNLFGDSRELIQHFDKSGLISSPWLIASDPKAQEMMQRIQHQLSSITDFSHTHPHCGFARDIGTQFATTLNAIPQAGRANTDHVLQVLEQEMAAHAARIQANIDAAHDEQAISKLVQMAAQSGLENLFYSPLHRSSGELLGWALRFRRAV
ncbi:MAG: hypothetical protein CMQ46_04040 [Gammaproteobacteria bacterium]|nr:hypothetical protein [Gammaproteobacteria bacterium]MBJ54353.1 hypothetical protein [Gammaproteobacteria bacterium]MBJ54416.1 hypothetical protein [Gammaproteobacteria bacterium]HBN15958.1 hypothetical protein [Pseudohongiella sp.]|tara:strand:- start:103 stop:1314 length:1212 start_codon:yes stop_codon:yes gene_type:complete